VVTASGECLGYVRRGNDPQRCSDVSLTSSIATDAALCRYILTSHHTYTHTHSDRQRSGERPTASVRRHGPGIQMFTAFHLCSSRNTPVYKIKSRFRWHQPCAFPSILGLKSFACASMIDPTTPSLGKWTDLQRAFAAWRVSISHTSNVGSIYLRVKYCHRGRRGMAGKADAQ